MSFSIDVDDWGSERWEFVGRNVLTSNCSHDNEGKPLKESGDVSAVDYQSYCNACDISEDTGYPMMNYCYPINDCPSDEAVLELHKRANLTVVGDNETDDYYLALTGGDMDLSQDIALAYVLIGEPIPFDLCIRVNPQKNLSVHGEDFKLMADSVIDQLNSYIKQANYQIDEVRKQNTEVKA